MMDKTRQDGLYFEKSWEIEIEVGSLKMLDPIIASVATELHSGERYFEVREDTPRRTDYFTRFNVFVINLKNLNPEKEPIGAFSLQWLGSNRARLIVLPRSQWSDGLTPIEKITLGFIERDDKTRNSYDEYFRQFIKGLEERLEHYGLKTTFLKRLWCGFKQLAGIYKAVKP